MQKRIKTIISSRQKGQSTKTAPAKQKNSKPPRSPPVSSVQHRLDQNAQKWLRLIRDPCGADLTPPCYAGTGEGYLIRSKDIITIPATAVDGVFEISPSWWGDQIVRYGWSDTVGGSLGNASVFLCSPFIRSQVVGRYRPAAACAKVFYQGTELERKGQVGLNLSAGRTLTNGEAIYGPASLPMAACGYTGRTPSDHVEVKWVPNEADATWWPALPNGEEDTTAVAGTGNSMTIVFTNVPAGSLRIELTTVYEWQPSEEVSAGLVTTAKGPSSRNHLNEILAALGDLSQFAYNKYGHKLIPAIAQLML